jgi:Protein of unknown function (DUF2442)
MSSFAETAPDIRVKDVQFGNDCLTVQLMDGRSITVPLAWYPRLFSATRKQRERWEISGGGYGIHWPEVDEDLSTEGLLRGAPAAAGSLVRKYARVERKKAARTKAS